MFCFKGFEIFAEIQYGRLLITMAKAIRCGREEVKSQTAVVPRNGDSKGFVYRFEREIT